jgi:rhamnogalacturonyl hydrolase YesR
MKRNLKLAAILLLVTILPGAASGGRNGIGLDGITAPSSQGGTRIIRTIGWDDRRVGDAVAELIMSYKHHTHSYRTAVFLFGLILWSDATGEEVHSDYVMDFLQYYFDNRDIRDRPGRQRAPTDAEMLSNRICPWCCGSDSKITDNPQVRPRSNWIKEVDGTHRVIPFGSSIVGGPALEELALRTADPRFLEFLRARHERELNARIERNRPVTEPFYPKFNCDGTTYSGVLSRMGLLFDDQEYFKRAIEHALYRRHVFDPVKKIFYQGYGWGTSRATPNPGAWGRGAGWWIYVAMETLVLAPKTTPGWTELRDLLVKNLEGLKRYQDSSGMWHQLVDRWDSYPETSGTGLAAYGIIKAVRHGIIDQSYVHMGLKAFEGLKGYIDSNGIVRNCCIGCGVQDDVHDYYCRSMQVNDPHAPGPVLMAASQVAMYRNGIAPIRRRSR